MKDAGKVPGKANVGRRRFPSHSRVGTGVGVAAGAGALATPAQADSETNDEKVRRATAEGRSTSRPFTGSTGIRQKG